MAYAVFTHRAGPFDTDALRAAFAATPTLTTIDAKRAERHGATTKLFIAGGVLTVGMQREVAEALARELTERGIHATPVDESWLALPVVQTCKKVELTSAAFTLHLYDGPLQVAWPEVACVSAGVVSIGRNLAPSDAQPIPALRYGDRAQFLKPGEVIQRDRSFLEQERLVLDVVVETPLRRFRFQADQFVVLPSGRNRADSPYRDRQTTDEMFALNDLVRWAESAATSHGTDQLLSQGKPHRYASTRDFAHEIAWLLWRHRGPAVNRRNAPFSALDESAAERSISANRALLDKTREHSHLMAETQSKDAVFSATGGMTTALLLGVSILERASSAGVFAFALVGAAITAVLYSALRAWRSRRFWESRL